MNPGFGLTNLTSITAIELSKAGWGSALVLLLAGIALLFAGRLLIKTIVSVGFGVLLAYLGLRVLSLMRVGQLAEIVAVLVLFVIGFLVGWTVFKLSLSLISGLGIGLIAGSYLGLNLLYTLLLSLVLIVIIYLIVDYIISVIAALAGLVLIYISVNSLAGTEIAVVFVVLMAILAVVAKARLKK